jgi:hypothetical protein
MSLDARDESNQVPAGQVFGPGVAIEPVQSSIPRFVTATLGPTGEGMLILVRQNRYSYSTFRAQ